MCFEYMISRTKQTFHLRIIAVSTANSLARPKPRGYQAIGTALNEAVPYAYLNAANAAVLLSHPVR